MFFEYRYLLWLLIVPLLLVALYVWRELSGRQPHLRVSKAEPWPAGGGRITMRSSMVKCSGIRHSG